MIDGRTVMEVNPKCKSALEISALWDYMADRLSRLEDEGYERGVKPVGPRINALGKAAPAFGRRVSASA